MKAKTLDELKKSYEERLTALKKEKEEVLKKAKARETKTAAAERIRLRKLDTHIKIILGGYLLAELKKNKDKSLLDKIVGTLKSEREKKVIKDLTLFF